MTAQDAIEMAYELKGPWAEVTVIATAEDMDMARIVGRQHTLMSRGPSKSPRILRARNVWARIVTRGEKRFLASEKPGAPGGRIKVVEYVPGTDEIIHLEV